MKRVLVPLALPAMKGTEAAECDFDIADPGDIAECLIQVKPIVGGIVMAPEANKPQFEFIPTMLVNIDPDLPPKRRHFIISPPMQVIESEKDLVYRGRFLFPDGKMLCMYEEVEPAKSKLLSLP